MKNDQLRRRETEQEEKETSAGWKSKENLLRNMSCQTKLWLDGEDGGAGWMQRAGRMEKKGREKMT